MKLARRRPRSLLSWVSIASLAGLLGGGVAACTGDDGGDLAATPVYNPATARVEVHTSRPLADGETLHVQARRGHRAAPDCAAIAAAAPSVTDVGSDDDGILYYGPLVDSDLLEPFYGPEWAEEPTPEMLASLANGTDSLVDVCIMKGDRVVLAQEADLFAAADAGRDVGLGGKADDPTSGETNISSVQKYGERCVAELGEIPFFTPTGNGEYTTFDCLGATPIPMTVTTNGNVTSPTSNVTVCDNPQHIYSLCETGPRVAERTNDQGTRWVLLCRKSIGGLASNQYNDIAMIGNNPFTGKTCFFQNALYSKTDGGHIPHPADKTKSVNLWSGVQGGMGNGIQCSKCHDADAFVHTPWIDGAKDGNGRSIVPKMGEDDDYPIGANDVPYHLVNAAGQGWTPQRHITDARAAACTSCHRMGKGYQWQTWISRIEGTDSAWNGIVTADYKAFAKSHWMPLDLTGLDASNWASSPYGQALTFIKTKCTASASNANCASDLIPQTVATGTAGALRNPLPNMSNADLATQSLQILGAGGCNSCHAITRAQLRTWDTLTDQAEATCLAPGGGSGGGGSGGLQTFTAAADATLAQNEFKTFGPYTVPAGGTFTAAITGTGDADLYVKKGAAATTAVYDCRPYGGDANETCGAGQFDNAGPGQFYVAVNGYSAATIHLAVTWTAPATTPPPSTPTTAQTITDTRDQTVVKNQFVTFGPYDVAAGGTLTAVITGTGDADLYVKKGAATTTSVYDCRPYGSNSNETCGAQQFANTGPGQFYVAVNGYAATSTVHLVVTYTKPGTADPTPVGNVDCMRFNPSDHTSPYVPAKLGIYAAAAHQGYFANLFKAAFPVATFGNDGWVTEYSKFKSRVAMPKGNNPRMTQAQFDVIAEWFARGLPELDARLPDGNVPLTCTPYVSTTMTSYISTMATQGWAQKNKDRGLNMYGCAAGQTGAQCLSSLPRAGSTSYGTGWESMPNSKLRILRELSFNTFFWMRSSPDGRFVANGGGTAGATISDLQAGRDIPVNAAYDPGFFPDNSGWVFQGTPIGTGFCTNALLQSNPASIDFSQPQCSSVTGVGLYQHLGLGVGGSDYFTINSQFTSDNGGGSFTSGNPSAGFSQNSQITLTPMVFDGSHYTSQTSVGFSLPFMGDSVMSPSTGLVISRLAGPNSEQLGYVVHKVTKTQLGSTLSVGTTEVARYCNKGGKPAISFNEKYAVVHEYVENTAEGATSIGFADTNAAGFQAYKTQGAANIYVINLATGVRTRVTMMKPGQYALYPHFRSDGWIYFLVKDSTTHKEYAVASDAAIVLN